MNVVWILISNIFPLYLLIGLGYIAGRWLNVDLKSLANVLIFIISPIVVLGGMIRLNFTPSYILLPLTLLIMSAAIGGTAYRLAHWRWKSNTANLIGLGSVSCNSGYFGMPLVLALYGQGWAALYLFMNMALTVAENTFGYFMAVRGHHTFAESLKKVARLPSLHALYIGLALNFCGVTMTPVLERYWTYAVGTWPFIGMMLIGVALAKLPKLAFDARLLGWLFAVKFLCWPLLAGAVIAADTYWLHWFPPVIHGLLLMFATAPLMANLAAYAAQLNLHRKKPPPSYCSAPCLRFFICPSPLSSPAILGWCPEFLQIQFIGDAGSDRVPYSRPGFFLTLREYFTNEKVGKMTLTNRSPR